MLLIFFGFVFDAKTTTSSKNDVSVTVFEANGCCNPGTGISKSLSVRRTVLSRESFRAPGLKSWTRVVRSYNNKKLVFNGKR